jgi:hypothetical protein
MRMASANRAAGVCCFFEGEEEDFWPPPLPLPRFISLIIESVSL